MIELIVNFKSLQETFISNQRATLHAIVVIFLCSLQYVQVLRRVLQLVGLLSIL